MKILIRNMDRDITEAELADLFKPFGEIETCDLVMDKVTGLSKGFGFVEMPDEAAALKAIQALDGKKIKREKLRVKTAASA